MCSEGTQGEDRYSVVARSGEFHPWHERFGSGSDVWTGDGLARARLA